MATETFDQRFKRLTSDMLMIDICRILGIEIRDLMKIRSGVRIELPANGLRRLCQEQGLDYNSFAAGINEPWSSELRTSKTLPSEHQEISAPATVAASSQAQSESEASVFRADGSRVTAPEARAEAIKSKLAGARREPMLTVNNDTRRPPHQTSDAMDYTSVVGGHHDGDAYGHSRRSLADRFRDGLASAFKRIENEIETLPDEDFEQIPARRAAAGRDYGSMSVHEIQSLVAEVTLMRRELNELSTNVRRLLIR